MYITNEDSSQRYFRPLGHNFPNGESRLGNDLLKTMPGRLEEDPKILCSLLQNLVSTGAIETSHYELFGMTHFQMSLCNLDSEKFNTCHHKF